MSYTIRTMTRRDVDIAVEWAAREGWNPGWHDAECYFAADPCGFLIGELNGNPIATISVVKYGEAFGFLGFYIVRPEFRGMGYGLEIWKAGLNSLGDRNIGLDGVVAQQANYTKSGFKLAHRNMRFAGRSGGEATGCADIAALSLFPFKDIDAYGRAFFPEARSAFLRCWIGQPGAHALGIRRGGELAGYGVIRPCRVGWKIGPLFADGPELAEALFVELTSRTEPGDQVFLDVPESNRDAVMLAERHGMSVSFETARMYTKEAPDIGLGRTFGVASFEVG